MAKKEYNHDDKETKRECSIQHNTNKFKILIKWVIILKSK